MRKESIPLLFSVAGLWWLGSQAVFGEKATGSQKEVGIVSNIKILSGNVDDVSDVEAWKASFLKPDMTDREKAMAVWNSVGRAAGPVVGSCKFVSFDEIPAGIGKALVRFTGRQNNTAMIFSLRIDADYIEPNGGFHPVKTTYSWEENGREMHHVHIADSPHETYVIHCQAKPIMRSLTVELSD